MCPICKKEAAPAEVNPVFPFCSPRCKLLDLGAWLDGRYRIPGEPVAIDDLGQLGEDALAREEEGDS